MREIRKNKNKIKKRAGNKREKLFWCVCLFFLKLGLMYTRNYCTRARAHTQKEIYKISEKETKTATTKKEEIKIKSKLATVGR